MPVKKTKSIKGNKSITSTTGAKTSDTRGIRKSRDTLLSVPVYSLSGRESGVLSLPKEVFGRKVNKELLSQAIRVYSFNKKVITASTKTRGEVRGSTVKIFRQKGTGRARHGAITAPIFVGGGIVFGPKMRKVTLDLPRKMKKAALISALSSKAENKKVLGLSGIEKATGKTKEMAKMMSSVISHQSSDKKQKKMSVLIITAEKMDNIVHGVKNIPGVSVLPANLINAYEVLKHELLLVTQETADKLNGEANPSTTLRARSERVKKI